MLGAIAHDDLGCAIAKLVISGQFLRDCLAQFWDTGTRRVFREAGLERRDRGRLDVLGCIEIWFTRAEAANIDALCFHRFGLAID